MLSSLASYRQQIIYVDNVVRWLSFALPRLIITPMTNDSVDNVGFVLYRW